MIDLYFSSKMANQGQFIHDYQRFAKPYGGFIDWDLTCAMIVSKLNISDTTFHVLSRQDTKDGYERNFEFKKDKVDGLTLTEYIGWF